jgi:hypothetical protein
LLIQSTALTPRKFGGGVAFAHDEPPSLLVMNTGVDAPWPTAPEATHVEDVHETSKTDADEAGRVTALKVLPPSVVWTASADNPGSSSPPEFGPTAMQLCSEVQEMEKSWFALPLTATSFQVCPPSWLTTMPEPTPIHVVGLGHAKPTTPKTLFGMLAGVHVFPPSSDTNTSAWLPSTQLDCIPPTKH